MQVPVFSIHGESAKASQMLSDNWARVTKLSGLGGCQNRHGLDVPIEQEHLPVSARVSGTPASQPQFSVFWEKMFNIRAGAKREKYWDDCSVSRQVSVQSEETALTLRCSHSGVMPRSVPLSPFLTPFNFRTFNPVLGD